MFNNIYKDKKVVITGHTGFKGSWLTSWLLKLGANIEGISIDIPSKPSLFDELKLSEKIVDHRIDIRDSISVKDTILNAQPDFVFHLAAQPIVSNSYSDPLYTISTNVVGTANILDALRFLQKKCIVIIVTSDKCYDNIEWLWGYKETDTLGGKDIYSGSKGAAELIFKSYFNSFYINSNFIKMASVRAGNVIGGGDWAKDRIVPDCMNSWNLNKPVEIRSPNATRPWQHVLEPLSGYLNLASNLYTNYDLNGECFNFGPKSEYNHKVIDLLKDLSYYWKGYKSSEFYKITDNIPFHEASLLKLNCDKSLYHLGWEPNLLYSETIKFVSTWYYSYYKETKNMYELTINQIDEYQEIAKSRTRLWTK